MNKQIAKAIKRINNHLPLIGTWLRRKGSEGLSGTEEKAAVMPLINALKDEDQIVRENVLKAIHSLKGMARDHLCSLWADGRDKVLEGIILKAGYVADKPPILTAITSFLHGKVNGDQVWEIAKERPDSHIPAVLREKGWHPKDPAERALFYFLANDLKAYHDIDFEHSYLRIWYETGEKGLKEAIASRIRKSGDSRLLALFRTERGSRKRSHSHEETDLQIELLFKKRDYEELFHLLPSSAYSHGKKIISGIREAGWKHPDTRLRELQERLEEILLDHKKEGKERLPASYGHAIYQDFRPMLIGGENGLADETTLVSWTRDQGNFRRRSAGVVLLAEKGSSYLTEAANRLSSDPYWQVRMAAAAAELLRPGTLTPDNKSRLEDDHVYYVQAILKMPSLGRLAELNHDGIEGLKKVHISDPKKKPVDADNFLGLVKGFLPSAEREYLLTLAEFLGTEIIASEEISYQAGETDVEIEEG